MTRDIWGEAEAGTEGSVDMGEIDEPDDAAARRVAPVRRPDSVLGQAPNPALEIFVWSRLALWGAALFALLWFEPNRHPDAARWDTPALHDLGWAFDIWARWDSAFYLRIAEGGYSGDAAAAFYPLYPALVALGGRVLGGHYVLAGVVLSLAACLGAFLLLHRLAEAHLGAEGARRAVLYLALFPTSVFLSAVYAESLFLLLVLGAFLLAERRRFGAAGAVAGLALLTRPLGLALLPALALIAIRSPARGRALLGLCLAPLLFALYPVFLWLRLGDPLAFAGAQGVWTRSLSPLGPFGGVWDGLRAGWAGARQLTAGADGRVYWEAGGEPMHTAAVNLSALLFLVLFVALTVVARRRFGAPYGVFCAASLAIPLSVPSERWPLLSLPRFGLVVFPFILALAALGGRPRVHTAIAGTSALLLGVTVVQWALWQWVA